ncbi:hypothetical protein MATL_G00115180 [Megalops atlanticus]|uniref:Snake toxin/toxin-like domain-containing protein n=1 Tax=Megalops atlanticus TaxID=7932 RepID=A0A9D3TB13_MEGAT|nr:hypothetical protein MATL_G00115180 [Megalops atlanticus]
MKVLLLCLLLVLLCAPQVHSLRCYTCDGDPTCKTPTECPASSMYCRTEVTGTVFSRTCEEKCVEKFGVTCCMDDLCGP